MESVTAATSGLLVAKKYQKVILSDRYRFITRAEEIENQEKICCNLKKMSEIRNFRIVD